MPLRLFALLLSLLVSPIVLADAPLTEDFSGKQLSDSWHINNGQWEVKDGMMIARELAVDDHAASARWKVPNQDSVIELRFKLAGAKMFHVGFDPAKGELKKKGHLFSLVISNSQILLKKHKDKANEKSKDEILAKVETSLPQNQWLDLRLETIGPNVKARIGNDIHLTAKDKTFAVKKPTVVFRVLGGDVQVDTIHLIKK